MKVRFSREMLKQSIRASGMTHEALCLRAGVRVSVLENTLNGRMPELRVPAVVLVRLVLALGIPLEQVMVIEM